MMVGLKLGLTIGGGLGNSNSGDIMAMKQTANWDNPPKHDIQGN